MKTHHWQNIAYLPVVNSLLEEQLKKFDHIENNADKSAYRDVGHIEYYHQLYQLWRKLPNKTVCQIEWLDALKHRLLTIKNAVSCNGCLN